MVADINYPEQYVLAVMEKTGGMPLYIEKVTEFLCQSQRPWLPDQGGEFSANVNKMIRELNFNQVRVHGSWVLEAVLVDWTNGTMHVSAYQRGHIVGDLGIPGAELLPPKIGCTVGAHRACQGDPPHL